MKILLQLAIIIAICFVGHVLSILIPLGIPSSVISMVLLFALFAAKVLNRDALDQAGDFMLQHMAIFMIPAAVSIMESIQLVSSQLAAFLLICLISTITTFVVTAYTVKLVCLLQRRIKRHA